jgi:hypothetical protein
LSYRTSGTQLCLALIVDSSFAAAATAIHLEPRLFQKLFRFGRR